MTTVGLPDTTTYTRIGLVWCLVAQSACAYGSEGSVFIRSVSATPVVARALNPQDESSSSSSTSTTVWLLTSPQPEKREVLRSDPTPTLPLTRCVTSL
jgi:hypothetical protein